MFRGIFFLLLSAVFFASATGAAKYITNISDIQSIEITFFRFVFGFIFASFFIIKRKESIIPKNKKWILLRVIFNTGAVILFFTGVEHSTVTEANMLNMAYPVFVVLLSPFINSEPVKKEVLLYLFLAMISVYLILNPELNSFNKGNIFALASAVFAGAAVSVLRQARKFDSSFIILFYLMGLGGVLNFFLMLPVFEMPNSETGVWIALCAMLGVLGQFSITFGYKYISAAGGAVLSTTRIFFAAVIGIVFFGEVISLHTIAGGFLLFAAVTGIAGGWRILLDKVKLKLRGLE